MNPDGDLAHVEFMARCPGCGSAHLWDYTRTAIYESAAGIGPGRIVGWYGAVPRCADAWAHEQIADQQVS